MPAAYVCNYNRSPGSLGHVSVFAWHRLAGADLIVPTISAGELQ